MNVTLWICQTALALVFGASGVAKSTMSKERMIATGQTGVKLIPLKLVRFGAGTELLAAVGLILPWSTGIAKLLTPLAAFGLSIIMVIAACVHTRLREPRNVFGNLVLLGLCLFVGIQRLARL